MHSDLDQPQREEVMLDYKNGKIDILVATDIVSRGIDITDIVLVINYDVPHDPEDYIHRIGRTARANAEGEAITFVSVDDQERFYRIEKFLEREIPKTPLPEGLGEAPDYDILSLDRRSSRKGGRSRSRKGGGGASGRSSREGRPGKDENRRNRTKTSAEVPAPDSTAAPATPSSSAGSDAPQKKSRRRNHRRRRGGNGGNNSPAGNAPAQGE